MKIEKVMKPLISVIVPVYKVEDFIICCLDSLSRQSLRDIEIILIDDASPDRCGEICEEFVAKDSRFRVFHHEVNRGLSAARNTGIKEATADYLMFVDSDDWVHKDFCKLPYECAVQYGADLVIFNRLRVKKFKNCQNEYFNNYGSIASGYKTKWEILNLLSSRDCGQAAWNKLYRKELFKDVSYPEGYICEDIGTTYKLVLAASCIYYCNRILYFWRIRDGSISSLKTNKSLNDYIEMSKQQYHDLTAHGYPVKKIDQRLKDIAFEYCIRKKRDLADTDYVYFSKTLKSSDQIPKGFSRRHKILFVLFKYCTPLFELICVLWGKKYDK